MKKFILIGLTFSMVLTLAGSVFAAGPAIYQRDGANGAVELSNLGGDDEELPLVVEAPRPQVKPASASRAGVDGAAAPAASANAQKSAAPAATLVTVPVDASKPDAPDGPESRVAQYRDSMLNPPLLPNGRPSNPAIQRRYLMVKKSDYVSGN